MSDKQMRLYRDLAWLWPLWGDPAEYAAWCDDVTRLIRQYARRQVHTLLNLGCGGGKNVHNLKRHYIVTGLDLSPAMLAQARALNPACTFVEGDMRHADLGRSFDAVLIDDAVAYMTSPTDLAAVFDTAYRHLDPGGVLIVSPDETRETFRQNHTQVTISQPEAGPEGVEVIFVENNFDPDPDDDTYEATMIYLIREGGRLRIEPDLHILGLFALDLWRGLLRERGFEVHESSYVEDGQAHPTFACVRP